MRSFGTTAAWLDRDPAVAVVLADIGVARFEEVEATGRHPDRVLNVGIREGVGGWGRGRVRARGLLPRCTYVRAVSGGAGVRADQARLRASGLIGGPREHRRVLRRIGRRSHPSGAGRCGAGRNLAPGPYRAAGACRRGRACAAARARLAVGQLRPPFYPDESRAAVSGPARGAVGAAGDGADHRPALGTGVGRNGGGWMYRCYTRRPQGRWRKASPKRSSATRRSSSWSRCWRGPASPRSKSDWTTGFPSSPSG